LSSLVSRAALLRRALGLGVAATTGAVVLAACTSRHPSTTTPVDGAAPSSTLTPAPTANLPTIPVPTGSITVPTRGLVSSISISNVPSFSIAFPSSAAPVSAGAQPDVPIGSSIQDPGSPGTLVWRVNGITFAQRASDGEKPQNARFAVVDVTVAATSGTVEVLPSSLTVETADSQEWTAYFTPQKFAPALQDRKLSAGQSERGKVTFDISAASATRIVLHGQHSAPRGWTVS